MPTELPGSTGRNMDTAEINSVLLTEISGSWRTSVNGVEEVKTKLILRKLFSLSIPSCRQRMILFALTAHSKSCLQTFSPHWAPHLRRLLHDHATRDTDKREVQPASKPDSLHSCVLLTVSWSSLEQIVLRLPVRYCRVYVKLQIDSLLCCLCGCVN